MHTAGSVRQLENKQHGARQMKFVLLAGGEDDEHNEVRFWSYLNFP